MSEQLIDAALISDVRERTFPATWRLLVSHFRCCAREDAISCKDSQLNTPFVSAVA
jgi:hypothetical protein